MLFSLLTKLSIVFMLKLENIQFIFLKTFLESILIIVLSANELNHEVLFIYINYLLFIFYILYVKLNKDILLNMLVIIILSARKVHMSEKCPICGEI